MRALKWLGMVVMVAGLAACGGGGGGGSSSNEPVVSTESFNLINAWINYAKQSPTLQFSVTGDINAVEGQAVDPIKVSGTGTFSETTLVTSSFGLVEDALKKTTNRSVTVSVVGSGQSINIPFAASNSYVTQSYAPLGGQDALGYRLVFGSINLPSSVKVGDKAEIYKEDIFDNALNRTKVGTQVVQFEVKADTATTALLNIIKTAKNMAGTPTDVSTVTFRLKTNGEITRLSEIIATSDGNVLYFTY